MNLFYQIWKLDQGISLQDIAFVGKSLTLPMKKAASQTADGSNRLQVLKHLPVLEARKTHGRPLMIEPTGHAPASTDISWPDPLARPPPLF